MTKEVGTLTEAGNIEINNLARYEHHKVIITVSNFVSDVVVKLEDELGFNLDELDRSFTLTEDGTEAFMIQGIRLRDIKVTFVSGDATLNVFYEGW